MTSLEEAKARSEMCENYAYDSSVGNAEVDSRQTSSSHVGFRGCSVLSAVSVPAEARNRFFFTAELHGLLFNSTWEHSEWSIHRKKHAISKS